MTGVKSSLWKQWLSCKSGRELCICTHQLECIHTAGNDLFDISTITCSTIRTLRGTLSVEEGLWINLTSMDRTVTKKIGDISPANEAEGQTTSASASRTILGSLRKPRRHGNRNGNGKVAKQKV